MEDEYWEALKEQQEYVEGNKQQGEQKEKADANVKGQELSKWLSSPPKVRTIDPKGGRPKKIGPISLTSSSKKSKAERLWTDDLRKK